MKLINQKTPFRKENKLRFITHSESSWTMTLCALSGIAGFVIATKFPVIGIVQALFSFAWMTHKEGVVFDFNKGMYKNVTIILSIELGTWRKLPLSKFLLLKKLSNASNWSSLWGDFTHRVYYYKIFLKSPSARLSLELTSDDDGQRAIETAEELADLFEAELKTDID